MDMLTTEERDGVHPGGSKALLFHIEAPSSRPILFLG